MPSRRNRRTDDEKIARDRNTSRESRSSKEPKDSNPPRTTSKGWLTTPKFGSSTSGGGEIEPGPERD
jgi:hypothetical protein